MRLPSGEVTVIRDVASPAESCTRTLRVFLPTGVQQADLAGVLVLLDGQNLFARAPAGPYGTWGVDDAMDAMVASGAAPWAIVGVDHREALRIADDSPWPDPRMDAEPRGHLCAAFLAEDLPAWLDDNLPGCRGRGARALGGSSLGGLMALYVGWLHAGTYAKIAAFSPSVMWSGGQLAPSWRRRIESQRIYLDVGARERIDVGAFQLDYGTEVRSFASHLRSLGYGEDALRVVIEPGGHHDEASWGRRFPAAMRWLLSDR